MDLPRALRIEPETRLALTGAGGKTTALFLLGEQIPGTVILTASTHLGVEQARRAERRWIVTRAEEARAAVAAAAGVKTVLLTGPVGADGRTIGLNDEILAAVNAAAAEKGYPVVVEADGSRRKPLKAPAEHEPAVPAWVDTVAVTVGLSALEQPLDEEHVHRAQIFAALSGSRLGDVVTAEMIARVLLHPLGGQKNIPAGARKVALLNQADIVQRDIVQADIVQADIGGLRFAAREMAVELLAGGFDSVLVAALVERRVTAVYEPAAGVVLAAGAAERFGRPKVLLEWQGEALVRRAARTALRAGLRPVRVVAGAHEAAIRAALEGLEVEIAPNPGWQQGQSTSVAVGAAGLERRCGSAVFLLADQPLVTVNILRELVRVHAETLGAIVAPRVNGRRANPVLFDRVTFDDLSKIRGDSGGRALFERYPVEWLESDDPGLLFDVDTPEDFEQLRRMSAEES